MTSPIATNDYLKIREISLSFGGVAALVDVSFDIDEGQIFSLIGPNGAGKSSLFNCISRLYQPWQGSISFKGTQLLDEPAHAIPGLGIGRTFQNCVLFRGMTVLENIEVGGYAKGVTGFLPALVRSKALRNSERELRARAAELLDYLELGDVYDRPAGSLDFPTQKRVELARALMTEPSLLLLDEPAGGLNTTEVADLMVLLLEMRSKFNLTMLLVEHRMDIVMSLSDQICVIEMGQVIANGSPADVRNDDAVIAAYLGHSRREADA
jgi:branched-chain amino acid transport system ATP-binding protein